MIRVLLCRSLGLPVSEALRFAPVPGRTHVVAGGPGGSGGTDARRTAPASDPGIGSGPPGRAGGRPAAASALAGSAGTGKTTLGRALAQRLDVPYIPEGMGAARGGLDSTRLGQGASSDCFSSSGRSRWRSKTQRSRRMGGSCDRSGWDYAAFRLLYRFTKDIDEVAEFYARYASVRLGSTGSWCFRGA